MEALTVTVGAEAPEFPASSRKLLVIHVRRCEASCWFCSGRISVYDRSWAAPGWPQRTDTSPLSHCSCRPPLLEDKREETSFLKQPRLESEVVGKIIVFAGLDLTGLKERLPLTSRALAICWVLPLVMPTCQCSLLDQGCLFFYAEETPMGQGTVSVLIKLQSCLLTGRVVTKVEFWLRQQFFDWDENITTSKIFFGMVSLFFCRLAELIVSYSWPTNCFSKTCRLSRICLQQKWKTWKLQLHALGA